MKEVTKIINILQSHSILFLFFGAFAMLVQDGNTLGVIAMPKEDVPGFLMTALFVVCIYNIHYLAKLHKILRKQLPAG